MKRVLIFSTAYVPFIGGAEVAVREITDRLGNGIEFDMITARMDRKLSRFEVVGAVNVHRIGYGIPLLDKLLVPFAGAISAWQLEKEYSYDAFWCIMASYASGAAYIVNGFRAFIRRKKVPVILTLQEGDSEKYLRSKWAGLVDLSWRLSLRRSDVLTVISTYLGKRAKALGFRGVPALIPNGVPAALFSKTLSEAELLTTKEKLGKREGDVFLITTSRLNVKNAVADVISALALLPENVKFLVLGVGELEQSLKALAKKLGVADRVQFLGLVSYKDIPPYLHASDIFIRPSLSEGMGNSFIEAMAAGLPVIATPVGGIPDFLFDPETDPDKPSTGLFAEVKNPESIARQVKRLMNDPALRAALIENGQKLAAEKYDWDLIANEMKEKVFDAAL